MLMTQWWEKPLMAASCRVDRIRDKVDQVRIQSCWVEEDENLSTLPNTPNYIKYSII